MTSSDHDVPGTISSERIEELRRIYKATYGEEITLPDAIEMAHKVVALYKLVLRPLPGEPSRHLLPPQPPAQSAAEVS